MKTFLVLHLLVMVIGFVQSLSLHAPQSKSAEVGRTLSIQCDLQQDNVSTLITAEDIRWLFNSSPLSTNLYSPISNSTSVLSLPDITFSDEGNYSCVLDDVTMATTQVSVGVRPNIANFTCTAHNMRIMWCTWDEVDSHLPTEYVFTYKHNFESDDEWKSCPDITTKGSNSCYFSWPNNAGSLHNMKVTATNSLGNTETIKNFNPDTESIPDPPYAVQVITKTAHSVKVKWKPSSLWYHPNIYTLSYKLQFYSEWEPEIWSEEINAYTQEFFTLNGLEPYTRYDVRVAAFPNNGGYWSDWSSVAIGYTAEADPSVGVNVHEVSKSIHGHQRDVTIAWQPLTRRESNGNITRYFITVKDSHDPGNSNNTDIPAGTTTEYTIKDLQRYKAYEVGIRAINNAGSSPPSFIRILDERTAPSRPNLTSVKAISDSAISVSWEAPVDPNGEIKSYTLAYLEDDGTKRQWTQITVNSSVFNYVVQNLRSQVPYEFKVQAKNEVGFGDFSNVVRLYTLEGVPDGPPTDLVIKNIEKEPTALNISWNPPCKEERNGIIRLYGIHICQSDEGLECEGGTSRMDNFTVIDPNSLKASRAEQHYVMRELKANTQYVVSVSAFTSQGQGPPTGLVLGKTSMGAPEDVPKNLQIPGDSVTDTKLTITWSPPEQPNTNVTYYRVKASPLNNTKHCQIIPQRSNKTKWIIENLCGYETYQITVSACNDAPISEPCGQDSDPVYARTEIGVPSAPQEVNASSLSSEEIRVFWLPPLRPNGPLYAVDYMYVVTCVMEVTNTSQEMFTKETKETATVVDVNCGNVKNDEGVQARCNVSASRMDRRGPATSANEALVCYSSPVWQYILLPLIALAAIGGMVVCVFKCYKSSEKHGAWEPVPQPSIPKKTTDLPHDTKDLFETYDDILQPGTTNLDGVSTHSSDHGVDLCNGHKPSTVAVNNKNNEIRKPGHVTIEVGGVHKDKKRAVGPLSPNADDYTQISEIDGQPVLPTIQGGELPQTGIAGTTCEVGDYSTMTEEPTPGRSPSRIINLGRGTTHPVTLMPAIQEVRQAASDRKPAVVDVPAVQFRGTPRMQEQEVTENGLNRQGGHHSNPEHNQGDVPESGPPIDDYSTVGDLPQATPNNDQQVNNERDYIDDYTAVGGTAEVAQEDTRQPETNAIDYISDYTAVGETAELACVQENRQPERDSSEDDISDYTAVGETAGQRQSVVQNNVSTGTNGDEINDYTTVGENPSSRTRSTGAYVPDTGYTAFEDIPQAVGNGNTGRNLGRLGHTNSRPGDGEVRRLGNGDVPPALTMNNEDYISDYTAIGETGGIVQNERREVNGDIDTLAGSRHENNDSGLPIGDNFGGVGNPAQQVGALSGTTSNGYVPLDGVHQGPCGQDDSSHSSQSSSCPETSDSSGSSIPIQDSVMSLLNVTDSSPDVSTNMDYMPNTSDGAGSDNMPDYVAQIEDTVASQNDNCTDAIVDEISDYVAQSEDTAPNDNFSGADVNEISDYVAQSTNSISDANSRQGSSLSSEGNDPLMGRDRTQNLNSTNVNLRELRNGDEQSNLGEEDEDMSSDESDPLVSPSDNDDYI
ncbi:uncharacterized protein LOC144436178 [Glandiceps talaboti]